MKIVGLPDLRLRPGGGAQAKEPAEPLVLCLVAGCLLGPAQGS